MGNSCGTKDDVRFICYRLDDGHCTQTSGMWRGCGKSVAGADRLESSLKFRGKGTFFIKRLRGEEGLGAERIDKA